MSSSISHSGEREDLIKDWTCYQISLSRTSFLEHTFLSAAWLPPQGGFESMTLGKHKMSIHGTLHRELQVGLYGNKTSPFPTCKGKWHGTPYSQPVVFSTFLPEKDALVHTTYWDQSLFPYCPRIVTKLPGLDQTPPALLAFGHFHHFLRKRQIFSVLYLGLKALYIYWNGTSGQFSGFSKHTREFLPAVLGRGRCWEASKGHHKTSSMWNPSK